MVSGDLDQVEDANSILAVDLGSTTGEVSTDTHLCNIPEEVPTPPQRICLVAGDSYAARLDVGRLGRQSVVVRSVAHGGAKIHQVMEQLQSFKSNNSDVIVEKLLISVGTNDIRYCSNGLYHLKGKVKSLFALIKEVYPHTKVYFQSLIPLPCRSREDWLTNRNVLDFNKIIFTECIFHHFYIMRAFEAFADHNRDFRSPELRNSKLF